MSLDEGRDERVAALALELTPSERTGVKGWSVVFRRPGSGRRCYGFWTDPEDAAVGLAAYRSQLAAIVGGWGLLTRAAKPGQSSSVTDSTPNL